MSEYANQNDRTSCVCGEPRSAIADRVHFVGDWGSLVWAPYYYRCPTCLTLSAVNLRFEPASYQEVPIEQYAVSDRKLEINRARVAWIRERAGFPDAPVIFDLGAGEGAFTRALADGFPSGLVHAVEADTRMPARFPELYARAAIAEEYIEPFLARPENFEAADLIVMTDVLEHVLDPDEMLLSIRRALKPGGFAFITTPNADSLVRQEPLSRDQVNWATANFTYQHLWVMTRPAMTDLMARHLDIREFTLSFETNWRQDGQYSTYLLRK